jgi:hypothetical protein
LDNKREAPKQTVNIAKHIASIRALRGGRAWQTSFLPPATNLAIYSSFLLSFFYFFFKSSSLPSILLMQKVWYHTGGWTRSKFRVAPVIEKERSYSPVVLRRAALAF